MATKTKAKTKPAGIATLDVLAGIAAPPAAKNSGKSYPPIPEDSDGLVAKLADSLARDLDQFKALEGAVKTVKAELTSLGRRAFYNANSGKADPTSSVEARGEENNVLVTFQNRYGSGDPAAITELIGEEAAGEFFYQSFELKIKGDAIPAASAPAIIQAIAEVLAAHDCSDALTANAVVKPNKTFHTARHSRFDPETNLALDRLIPPVAVVKTKTS